MNDVLHMVRFPLEDGGVEIMHASRRSDGLLCLDNSPFHAYGISNRGVFSAAHSADGLTFLRLEERGGHPTYRVKLQLGKDHDSFLRRWGELEALGCTYEGSGLDAERLYVIDVPPATPVAEVYRMLGAGETGGAWVFEEAHFFTSDCDPRK
jgi:hypothetical protein